MTTEAILTIAWVILFCMNIFPLPLPPAFTVMTAFYVGTDVPLLPLTIGGSLAAALGRGVFALGVKRFEGRIPDKQRSNAAALAPFINQKVSRPKLFVVAYSFTGLTSNPLFVAVGLGALPLVSSDIAFFLARSLFNTIMVLITAQAVESAQDLADGDESALFIVLFAVGFVAGYAILLSLPWARWLGIEDASTQVEPRAEGRAP